MNIQDAEPWQRHKTTSVGIGEAGGIAESASANPREVRATVMTEFASAIPISPWFVNRMQELHENLPQALESW